MVHDIVIKQIAPTAEPDITIKNTPTHLNCGLARIHNLGGFIRQCPKVMNMKSRENTIESSELWLRCPAMPLLHFRIIDFRFDHSLPRNFTWKYTISHVRIQDARQIIFFKQSYMHHIRYKPSLGSTIHKIRR